jgi:pilus assembly protein CpaC
LDGQTFAIGGLIKNNVIESVSAIPLLGEIPILGALFRSSEFISDRSELMFIVTPRLVRPLTEKVSLPTDQYQLPSRGEFLFGPGPNSRESRPPARPVDSGVSAEPIPPAQLSETPITPSSPQP